MFPNTLINNLKFTLEEIFPEVYLQVQKDNIKIFLSKNDFNERKVTGIITKGKKFYQLYIFKNNKKIKKIKFKNIFDIKIYLQIIKALLESDRKKLPKKKFDLHTFLQNLRKDLKIENVQNLHIYFGVTKGDIKRFRIEYFGEEPLENVLKYISKYFKMIENKVEIPIEINF